MAGPPAEIAVSVRPRLLQDSPEATPTPPEVDAAGRGAAGSPCRKVKA